MAATAEKPELALFAAKFGPECSLRKLARDMFVSAATQAGLNLNQLSGAQLQDASCNCTYWAVTADSNDLLLQQAEKFKIMLPLLTDAGEPLKMRDQRPDDSQSRTDGCCCSRAGAAQSQELGQPWDSAANTDYISAPFILSRKSMYCNPLSNNSRGEGLKLGRSQRILLINSILEQVNIASMLSQTEQLESCAIGSSCCSSDCDCCSSLLPIICSDVPITLEELKAAGVFTDSYALHDPSLPKVSAASCRGSCCCCCSCSSAEVQPQAAEAESSEMGAADLHSRLAQLWICCRHQPIGLMRLYFGERIAFYYSWCGYTLWALMLLCVPSAICLLYGIVYSSVNFSQQSAQLYTSLTTVASRGSYQTEVLTTILEFVRLMFENHLTLPFGILLIGWAVLLQALWQRYEMKLAYRWDVNCWQLAECRRIGSSLQRPAGSGVCCRGSARSPRRRYYGLFSCLLTFAVLVLGLNFSFQVARFIGQGSYCESGDFVTCFIFGTALPVGGNVIVIVIMEIVYNQVAKWITKWESHEYQSDFDNSYAIKAFAFAFVNHYSPLYYVAFVRQGNITIAGFSDSCTLGDTKVACFTLLNIMVIGFIFGKTLLHSIVAAIWPPLLQCISSSSRINSLLRRCSCCCRCFSSVGRMLQLQSLRHCEQQELHSKKEPLRSLINERHLAESKELLVDEYLQTVINFGYVILFGSAFYLTPLLAVVVMAIDLRLDARRLLFSYRRPVPLQSQGMGVWNGIIDFLTYAGIVTTGAVLAFTSQNFQIYTGAATSDLSRLLFFIVFENAMLCLKLVLGYTIGRAPHEVRRCIKWEYANIPKAIANGSVTADLVHSLRLTHERNLLHQSLFSCMSPANSNPESGPQIV